MLTQMCGGNQDVSTQALRERMEDLVNNKVDTEKAVSWFVVPSLFRGICSTMEEFFVPH